MQNESNPVQDLRLKTQTSREKRVGESFNNTTLRMIRVPLAFHKRSLLHGHLYVVCKKTRL